MHVRVGRLSGGFGQWPGGAALAAHLLAARQHRAALGRFAGPTHLSLGVSLLSYYSGNDVECAEGFDRLSGERFGDEEQGVGFVLPVVSLPRLAVWTWWGFPQLYVHETSARVHGRLCGVLLRSALTDQQRLPLGYIISAPTIVLGERLPSRVWTSRTGLICFL